MITADQLVAHAIGDYVLQSDWMANEKTKKSAAALCHAGVYSLTFLIFHPSFVAFMVILATHFAIDRWRLARYVVYAKNFLAPKWFDFKTIIDGVQYAEMRKNWHSWADCSGTGYHKDRPAWLAVWLLIIADNVMHIVINGLALRYL